MEGNRLDTNERGQEQNITLGKDARINVMVNTSNSDDAEINLGNIFHSMKQTRRVYAWVIVLCLLAGICAPLLMYQFSKPKLTVASVVTLNYDVIVPTVQNGAASSLAVPVTDLTAPDGTELDLSQILSSYVLNNALAGMNLSSPISVTQLRSNIKIQRVLNEDSRRAQELAAKMAEEKNAGVFTQAQSIDLAYDSKFIVRLTNGFEDENSKSVLYLESDELRLLLNRVLDAYNDYLVLTYADMKLPEDSFSVIDPQQLDILESLELLRTAVDRLNEYCEEKPESVRTYRSWKTGRTLDDWYQALQTNKEVSVDYLYSYVYTNSIVKNREAMLVSYRFQLRNAQSKLDTINKNIETVASILKNYKNDDIFVSMQESDSSKSTSTTTDYFNRLILEQATNYQKAAEMEVVIADLNDKIAKLDSNENSSAMLSAQEEILEEVENAIENSSQLYSQIKAHMEEVHESFQFTHYLSHTSAQGKELGFLAANITPAMIGMFGGALVGCGIWFCSALIPELLRTNRPKKAEKEVAA